MLRNDGEKDPSKIMQSSKKESQLEKTLFFIMEFMRQVIEGGKHFNANHFFILMLQLTPAEIKFDLDDYLAYLIRTLRINEE